MSEKDNRKASDILLDLENKVEVLIQVITSHDSNIKMLLNKVNEISRSNIKQQVPNVSKEEFPSFAPIAISDKPTSRTRSTRENVKISAIPAVQNSIQNANEQLDDKVREKPKNDGLVERKIPIMQRVCDDRGKDLFMADVIIYDEHQNQIQKIKTNAVGKYQTVLTPGKYKIHISKMDMNSNSKIESMQEIDINTNDKAISLPLASIKRTAV